MSSPENAVVLRCAFCGAEIADLRAERCASCTRPIRATLKRLGVDFDSLTVYTDLPCTHCDYNLRTMHVESKCPECGMPVANSLAYNDLAYADRAWLRRVRDGVRCILIAMYVVLPLTILVPALPVRGARTLDLLGLGLLVIVLLFLSVGFNWVTSNEPCHRHGAFERINRATSQFSSAMTLSGSLLLIPIAQRWLDSKYLDVLLAVSLLAVPLGLVSTLFSLRAIAIRIRRTEFEHFGTVTVAVLCVTIAAGVYTTFSSIFGIIPAVFVILLIISYGLLLIAFTAWQDLLSPKRLPHPPFATDIGDTMVNE